MEKKATTRQMDCQVKMDKYLDDYSIDEILKTLICDSDLIEVTSCLDMIAKDEGKILILMDDDGRVYPAEGVQIRPLKFMKEFQMFNNLKDLEAPKIQITSDDIDTDFGKDESVELTPVSHIYKGGFFKNRDRLNWRVNPVVQALISTFNLTSLHTVIDVGCAIGDYVQGFNKRGIPCWGIEGSEAAEEFMQTNLYQIKDLRIPFADSPGMEMDHSLCFSLEVAEHIEPKYAGVYLDNLVYLSHTILMSVAPPGQEGHGHVNCQPKGYWEAGMKARNYLRNLELEESFKKELRAYQDRKEIACYLNNLMIFQAIRHTGRM